MSSKDLRSTLIGSLVQGYQPNSKEFKEDDFRWAETKVGEDSPTGNAQFFINHKKFEKAGARRSEYEPAMLLGESLHVLKSKDPERYDKLYDSAMSDPQTSAWLKKSYEHSKKEYGEKRPFEKWVRQSRLDQVIGGYFFGGKDSPIPTMREWDRQKLPYGTKFREEVEGLGYDLGLIPTPVSDPSGSSDYFPPNVEGLPLSKRTPSGPYHGKLAVQMASDFYGKPIEEMSPAARHIIMEEGFSADPYEDTKGITTQGVGLTGEFEGKDFFEEVVPVFEKRAAMITPAYPNLPPHVQEAIFSAVYRGDLAPKHKTAKLIQEGKWAEAAKEYLNHGDYKASKKKNQEAGKIVHGVQPRMERNAAAIASMQPRTK